MPGTTTCTTLPLLRYRYHIVTSGASDERTLLAEDCALLGFEGAPEAPRWHDSAQAEKLLGAMADANVHAQQAVEFVRRVVDGFDALRPRLEAVARERGDDLLQAHRRVRQAARLQGLRCRVEPNLPPDLLGIYVYLLA